MKARYASALILASLSFGIVSAPVYAQGPRAPEAGTRADLAPGRRDVDASRSLKTRTTGYASTQGGIAADNRVVTAQPAKRTLNVWGARVDAPNY